MPDDDEIMREVRVNREAHVRASFLSTASNGCLAGMFLVESVASQMLGPAVCGFFRV
ncbi:MAG TPA: hypothetical protein VLU25_10365 [Acidobacteriota bacterium]|nr:hypothetical protein [Acidobacteriota bacterium]